MAKGRHRANPKPWNWREEKKTLLNRWRFFWKPAIRSYLKGLKERARARNL